MRWLDRLLGSRRAGLITLAIVLLGAPILFTRYFVAVIMTHGLILGLVAATIVFLWSYAGVLSLAQIGVFGTAGFLFGNFVTQGETKGLNLGWEPWLAMPAAILAATAVAFVFGLVAARSAGIYFMMITLVYAVIVNYFFGQVTILSGFGGISNVHSYLPWPLGTPSADPFRLYYAVVLVSVLAYLAMTAVLRAPFGLAAQGVRDDPVRMASLGFNVALHRTLVFTFAGAIAAVAGVLFVWWNGHIDPATVGLGAALDLIVVAVIGGMSRLHGAWIGALFFVALENYVRNITAVGERFHTVIGLVFLLVVVASPGGLLGLWDRARGWLRPRPAATAPQGPPAAGPSEPDPSEPDPSAIGPSAQRGAGS